LKLLYSFLLVAQSNSNSNFMYVILVKVLGAGVARKGGRGVPTCVLQDEPRTRAAQMINRGMVKVAILKGDSQCPDSVATSVYDTKPVHFLSMSAESFKWIKKRDVYDKVKKGIVNTEFLRLNINDDYNCQMGHVDVADQLRNYYQMDHWMRKTKWWWSPFFWGVGVLIVNAYVVDKNFMKNKGREYISQYEFRRKICLAYIAPQEFW